jgi:lysophospholipase L1-like esterase
MPAALLSVVLAAIGVELWVRARWDHRRGTPGFFLSDARRGQQLAAGYAGWFAGAPVQINRLGFRDPREYSLEKPPGTFRILVIGDSVTFGHGATFETTYPYLLERRLKAWRPAVRWEVWNLGVPGYNTRQEATYLAEVGDRYRPDLVVVGFYPNDFSGNDSTGAAGPLRAAATPVVRLLQQYLYSFEFYKRAYLTSRWRLSRSDAMRRQLEHLQTEAELLGDGAALADAPEQQLTPVERFSEDQVRRFVCTGVPQVDPTQPGELAQRIRAQAPELAPWIAAVDDIKQLARERRLPLVFFINTAPEICKDEDRFYNGGSLADEAVLLEVLGQGAAATSSGRAFLHYRPSQMPLAGGHSLGNANAVKADVLFAFLSTRLLPDLLPGDHQ